MKILITRPEAKAKELQMLCTHCDIEAHVIPLLRITPRAHALWHAELKNLPKPDALLFVSPHAVDYFMAELPDNTFKSLPCFAPGQSTAELLRHYGFYQVTCPAMAENSEALLALPELQNVKGQNFLIVRGTTGRELIAKTLTARGAHVRYLAVYENLRRTLPLDEQQKLNVDYDVIVLTSTEALRYFLEIRKPRCEKITAMQGVMADIAQQFYPNKTLILSSVSNAYLCHYLNNLKARSI